MGNGIDAADTEEFAAVPDVAPAVAAALAVAVAAGLEDLPAGLLSDAAGEVLTGVPHPASAITAAPARTACADLYLLMSMPRSVLSRAQ